MPHDEIPLFLPERPLETDRLVLEPLRPSHAAQLYEHLLDRRLYTFIPQEPPVSEEAMEERYRKLSTRRSPDGREAWLNWALRVRGGGYVGLLEATVEPDLTAYVAYTVFVPYQRMGFATEGCEQLLQHLFGDYAITTVVAEIDTRNAASISLVERLGFERISLHENADHFNGAPSDEYRYELHRARRTPGTAVLR